VRYADDFVIGFQHRHEAEQFLVDLKSRLEQFCLALHPEKTRLIEFGRFAGDTRRQRGEGKPETFDFLGFTHICAKTRLRKWFHVWRKTIKKRLVAFLARVKVVLRRRMHDPIEEVGEWLGRVVLGYYRYHAVPGNCGRAEHGARRTEPILAESTPTAWSEATHQLGALRPHRQKLDTKAQSNASLPKRAFLRQTPKVGARCGNSARQDLCGGAARKGGPYRAPWLWQFRHSDRYFVQATDATKPVSRDADGLGQHKISTNRALELLVVLQIV